MRKRRARTMFISTLVLAAAGAIFLPSMPSVQTASAAVFAPVAHPSRAIGSWMSRQLDPGKPVDPMSPDAPRDVEAVYQQNLVLQAKLAEMEIKLRELIRVNRDREKLGDAIRPRCEPATVVGVVGDRHEFLQIAGAGEAGVDMAVLHIDGADAGIAGRVIETAPLGHARVQLITDPNSAIQAQFAMVQPTGEVVGLETSPVIVNGLGDGRCEVKRHKASDLESAGVTAGAWALLSDSEWPQMLQGLRLGRIGSIEPIPSEPGFVRVIIDPGVNFDQILEVMIFARP